MELMKRIQSMEGVVKEKISNAKKYIYQLIEHAF
jgi:hypothetical protein